MASPTETTATIVFVVRFWCEWTGPGPRWSGRVKHVESGRRMGFLGVEDLLGFFERFGITGQSDPASRGNDNWPSWQWRCRNETSFA